MKSQFIVKPDMFNSHCLEGCVLWFFRLNNKEMRTSKKQRDVTQILTNTVKEQVPEQKLPCWASCGVGQGLDLVRKCFFLEAIQMPTNGRVDK